MYVDDTLIYVSAKTPCAAADRLTSEMKGVSLDCVNVFFHEKKFKT